MIRVTKHNNLVSTVLDSVTENNIFIMPNILSPVANSEGLQGWHFKLGLDIISASQFITRPRATGGSQVLK